MKHGSRVFWCLSIALCLGFNALSAQSVTFRDIAANGGAGLDYRRVESPTEAIFDQIKQQPVVLLEDFVQKPIKSRGAPGVAIFDYDGDGDLDIYVTNGPGAANSLFDNQLAQSGQVTFVDTANAAGVGADDQDSTGVCYGDIDNDGDHDLLVLGRNEPNRFFENLGNGTFVDASASSGIGATSRNSTSCALGDVNGDGLLDIAVANTFDWTTGLAIFVVPFALNEHNQLFVNGGGNVFQDVSAAAGIESLNFPDPAHDGSPTVTWAISMADYDLDGDVDIIHADDQGAIPFAEFGGIDRGFVRVLENDGTGHFRDATASSDMERPGDWMGLSFGDFNSDGTMDVFGTNSGDYFEPFLGVPGDHPSRWFLGRGDGTFSDPGVGALVATPFGWGTSAADYDHDGDTDIIFHGGLDAGPFVELSNPGSLLLNDGSANFTLDSAAFAASTDHLRRVVHGTATGDLDDDGFVDVVSVSNANALPPIPLVPFPPFGGSPFDGIASFGATFNPLSPGTFVFAGIDLSDGTLSVELNSGNANRWVQIELMGTVGVTTQGRVNRDGIGAVVLFRPHKGNVSMITILGGSSHASQNSLKAHFGTGLARKGNVDVLWPGGVRNRLYEVHESERVLFPEIPCSFDAPRQSRRDYQNCVRTALDELVEAGVLTRGKRGRFLSSALKAFNNR